jgi:hypothetical protein
MPLKDGTQEDYLEAAVRHFHDAHRLEAAQRLDNAGHLIGFAAECAIKHKIQISAEGATSPEQHLPQLLPAARKRLGSRVGFAGMYNILKEDIFSDWAVDSRYSVTGKVSQEMFSRWSQITKRLFAAASIRASRD